MQLRFYTINFYELREANFAALSAGVAGSIFQFEDVIERRANVSV